MTEQILKSEDIKSGKIGIEKFDYFFLGLALASLSLSIQYSLSFGTIHKEILYASWLSYSFVIIITLFKVYSMMTRIIQIDWLQDLQINQKLIETIAQKDKELREREDLILGFATTPQSPLTNEGFKKKGKEIMEYRERRTKEILETIEKAQSGIPQFEKIRKLRQSLLNGQFSFYLLALFLNSFFLMINV